MAGAEDQLNGGFAPEISRLERAVVFLFVIVVADVILDAVLWYLHVVGGIR